MCTYVQTSCTACFIQPLGSGGINTTATSYLVHTTINNLVCYIHALVCKVFSSESSQLPRIISILMLFWFSVHWKCRTKGNYGHCRQTNVSCGVIFNASISVIPLSAYWPLYKSSYQCCTTCLQQAFAVPNLDMPSANIHCIKPGHLSGSLKCRTFWI